MHGGNGGVGKKNTFGGVPVATHDTAKVKEPESMLYEALYVIVGLFFNIYTSKKLKDRINNIKLKRIKVAENC